VDPKLFQVKVKSPSPELVKIEVKSASVPVVAPAPAPAKGKRRARTTGQKDKEKEREDKKKISHARKVSQSPLSLIVKTDEQAQQHPEHIPRPRNAFILFRKHVVDSKLIPTSVEIRHQNVSIITAKMWSEVSWNLPTI
jgi:HMG box factor